MWQYRHCSEVYQLPQAKQHWIGYIHWPRQGTFSCDTIMWGVTYNCPGTGVLNMSLRWSYNIDSFSFCLSLSLKYLFVEIDTVTAGPAANDKLNPVQFKPLSEKWKPKFKGGGGQRPAWVWTVDSLRSWSAVSGMLLYPAVYRENLVFCDRCCSCCWQGNKLMVQAALPGVILWQF